MVLVASCMYTSSFFCFWVTFFISLVCACSLFVLLVVFISIYPCDISSLDFYIHWYPYLSVGEIFQPENMPDEQYIA